MQATPYNRAAEMALTIYAGALDAVRGDTLVKRTLSRKGDELRVTGLGEGPLIYPLSMFGRVHICGAGKAAAAMALGAVEVIGDRVAGGYVVTKDGHSLPVPGVEVFESSHPYPDERSYKAAHRLKVYAESVAPGELVIFVLSGGASALIELPAAGVVRQDIKHTTNVLLSRPIGIEAINAVRTRLSQVKGGGLLAWFNHATVLVLVMSDIRGNPLRLIGSGPMYPSGSDDLDVEGVLREHHVWYELPHSVQQALVAARPVVTADAPPHVIVGDSTTAGLAAIDAARRLGLGIRKEPETFYESVEQLAATIEFDTRAMSGGTAHVIVGEPLVTVRGDGAGGRCQEAAALVAKQIARRRGFAFLAGSTDGTDGPTLASGGLVDGGSALRGSVSVDEALATSDSNRFLASCNGLVVTGPTQSNVNDLYLLIREP